MNGKSSSFSGTNLFAEHRSDLLYTALLAGPDYPPVPALLIKVEWLTILSPNLPQVRVSCHALLFDCLLQQSSTYVKVSGTPQWKDIFMSPDQILSSSLTPDQLDDLFPIELIVNDKPFATISWSETSTSVCLPDANGSIFASMRLTTRLEADCDDIEPLEDPPDSTENTEQSTTDLVDLPSFTYSDPSSNGVPLQNIPHSLATLDEQQNRLDSALWRARQVNIVLTRESEILHRKLNRKFLLNNDGLPLDELEVEILLAVTYCGQLEESPNCSQPAGLCSPRQSTVSGLPISSFCSFRRQIDRQKRLGTTGLGRIIEIISRAEDLFMRERQAIADAVSGRTDWGPDAEPGGPGVPQLSAALDRARAVKKLEKEIVTAKSNLVALREHVGEVWFGLVRKQVPSSPLVESMEREVELLESEINKLENACRVWEAKAVACQLTEEEKFQLQLLPGELAVKRLVKSNELENDSRTSDNATRHDPSFRSIRSKKLSDNETFELRLLLDREETLKRQLLEINNPRDYN